MREILIKPIIFFLSLQFLIISYNCTNKSQKNLVFVKGGKILNKNSNFYGKKIKDFYIGKYEVTQKEWKEIMGYNPSQFKGDNLPVESVNWYECIEFCNKKSIKEGLNPYYNIDKTKKDTSIKFEYDTLKWTITVNPNANGYRLPTIEEWEYAASGGKKSKGYIFSGSNNIDQVAWYWRNSGKTFLKGYWIWNDLVKNKNKTKPVGQKKPNELGIYDMSGNVREWCWNKYIPSNPNEIEGRIWKGGGWMGAEYCCEISFTGSLEQIGKGPDQGLRICRNK